MAPSLPYAMLRTLRAFPPTERAEVLEQIACHEPARAAFVADFHSNAERLRREGFSLIDVEHRPDALTSVWYFVESLGGEAPPHPRVEQAGEGPAGPVRADLSAAFDAAIAAWPGLEVERVILPGPDNPLLELHGDFEAVLVRPRSNAIWVDTRTAEVLLTTDGRDLNLHQRISEMADPLHFGYFGGYWTKVPWFLFGLAMTGLSVSGAAIYSLRIARERERPVRIARAFSGMWDGMGRWRWLSVLLLAIGAVMLVELFRQ